MLYFYRLHLLLGALLALGLAAPNTLVLFKYRSALTGRALPFIEPLFLMLAGILLFIGVIIAHTALFGRQRRVKCGNFKPSLRSGLGPSALSLGTASLPVAAAL